MMSFIVYLALAAVLGAWGISLATADQSVNGPVYLAVGIAMAIAGWLILTDRVPHFHPMIAATDRDLKKHMNPDGTVNTPSGIVPVHWCIIHGFISGFGTDGGSFDLDLRPDHPVPCFVQAPPWKRVAESSEVRGGCSPHVVPL